MATKLRTPPPRLDNDDGPVKISKASMGPFKFLKGRDEAEKKDRTRTWSRGLPSGYILDFIKYGLEPFLDEFGYKLSYSHKDCAAYCKQWAFAHSELQRNYKPKQSIQFLRCAHNGSREAFEWYLGIISPDDWFTLCHEWSAERFLDDSDVGHAQRNDIAWLVWNLLSLETSKEHRKFVEFINSEDDMDDEIYYVSGFNGEDGLGSYGGDRRTL
jgi:hypothetical protein